MAKDVTMKVGLKSSIVDDYDYRYAERNSHAIINALNNLVLIKRCSSRRVVL